MKYHEAKDFAASCFTDYHWSLGQALIPALPAVLSSVHSSVTALHEYVFDTENLFKTSMSLMENSLKKVARLSHPLIQHYIRQIVLIGLMITKIIEVDAYIHSAKTKWFYALTINYFYKSFLIT